MPPTKPEAWPIQLTPAGLKNGTRAGNIPPKATTASSESMIEMNRFSSQPITSK